MRALKRAYYRWSGSASVRGSGNPLVRWAGRGGLPPCTDPATQAWQAAALAPHVDAAFYARWYGVGAGGDPGEAAADYLRSGWRAGRDPRPDFSTAAYLAAHPHLEDLGVNPLLHRITRLAARGVTRLPAPDAGSTERLARRLVDGAFYLARNPDLAAAGVDPAAHYMASGWREGRDPAPAFDTLVYCLAHGLRCGLDNPLLHYVAAGGSARLPGEAEAAALRARTIAPYFDHAHYRTAGDTRSEADLVQAYVAGGWRALRSPRQDFDPAGFIAARAGNRRVLGDPFFQFVAETLLSGGTPFAGEAWGRFPRVDEAWYRTTYADVGGAAPYAHFSGIGWREGRDPGPEHSTLGTLLALRGPHPGRPPAGPPPVEDRGWIGAIGQAPMDRATRLRLHADLAGLHFDHAHYRRRTGLPEGADAVLDYCDGGWRRGCEPRADFDGWAYRADHPHVEATGTAPFVHFLATMLMRGVDITAETFSPAYGDPPAAGDAALAAEAEAVERFFDAAWYLRRYPDTRGFRSGPLLHFLAHGQEEDRDPSRAFSTPFYRRAYGHLLSPGESPFAHYVRRGRALGLLGAPEDLGVWPALEAPTPSAWDGLPRGLTIAQSAVVVIVPVYKGRAETLASLYACLGTPQATPFALLVVDDCAPDPALSAELAALSARGLFHLVRNARNRGFVASVNRGLSLRQGRPVVLLNADTQVYGDWLDRLAAHAEGGGAEGARAGPFGPVGSVTPLSNNATICSYPRFNADNAAALEIPRPDLDAAAATVNRGRALSVPTGVGFCLYLTAQALDAVGPLDAEAFGRGYGEENDWCQRARKAGFANLLAEDVYVYHAGQVSFGQATPGGAYDQGQAALLSKHPDYPGRVGQFVDADPGRAGRQRLDLYRLARHLHGRAVVLVTHSWGGGIQRHVEDLVADLTRQGTGVVVLAIDRDRDLRLAVSYRAAQEGGASPAGAASPAGTASPADGASSEGAASEAAASGGPGPLYLPNLDALSLPRDAALLCAFLGWLAPRLVHLHSLAGLRWAAAETLMDLVRAAGRPYAWTLHDYAPVCHRNHLVQPDGTFCGLAPVAVCRTCLAQDAPAAGEPDPGARRAAYGAFLAGATRVLAPSPDTAARIGAVWPDLSITVRPHVEADRSVRPGPPRRRADPGLSGPHPSHPGPSDPGPSQPPPSDPRPSLPPPSRPRRVAVLGAINAMKGGRVVQALAADARARGLPLAFAIVGHADPALTPALTDAGVTQTGRYAGDDQALDALAFAALQVSAPTGHLADAEILDLVAMTGADLVLHPAIWPETYAYALTLALRTGLPVAAFDLGAQGERLGAYPHGHVLPCALIDDPAALNDQLLAVATGPGARFAGPVAAAAYPDVWRDYYALDALHDDAPGPRPGSSPGMV